MNYASVCSGIGAPEMAWKDIDGWHPQWFSEIEKFPCRVLAYHFPHVPNLGDMTKLNNNPIYEQSIIDLLVGGTPCQSFSIAGLRGGLDDDRGNLSLEYCRILDKKRPRWFTWENVPGVLSSNGGKDFACILSAFTGKDIKPEGIGNTGIIQGEFYSIAWRILDAQYFGVPQRRRRVFVVGYLGNDWRPPAAVLFERESLRGNSAPIRKKGQEIAGTLTGGFESGGPNPEQAAAGHIVPMNSGAIIMAHGQGNAEIINNLCPSLTCNHEAPILVGDNISEESKPVIFQQNASGEVFTNKVSGTLNTNSNASGRNTPPLMANGPVSGNQGGDFVVSPTLTAYNLDSRSPQSEEQQRIVGAVHASISSIRRLTPLECERLQGLPDNYTNIPGAADGPRYKSIGNSMARPVMEWIGCRIDMVDNLAKKRK